MLYLWSMTILIPRATCVVNDILSGPCIFDWLITTACVIRSKIIRFYVSTSGIYFRVILVPRATCCLNDISSGLGNSKKYDSFDWLIKTACVIRPKIIRFYALDFTSGLRIVQLRRAFPSGCV